LVITSATTDGTLTAVIDNNDGTYTLVLTSSSAPGIAEVTVSVSGVSQQQTVAIEFTPLPLPPPSLFIPEGFSPDGDGVNDAFVIQGAEQYSITLKVYNRWGNIVYEGHAYKNDWEGNANQGIVVGQNLPDGTYFYAIDLNNGEKPFVRYFTIKRK
jgi:gliding motility-associated-like protein